MASIPTLSALSVVGSGKRSLAVRRAVDEFRRRTHGGVVLIGQSFEVAGDVHPTPIGAEPGTSIILNAVASLLNPGVIRDPPPLFEKAFFFLSVFLVSWIFACTNSIRANTAAVTGVLILVVPLSLILLQQGYWLDFAVPLVGIAIHRAFAEIEEAVDSREAGAHARVAHAQPRAPVDPPSES